MAPLAGHDHRAPPRVRSLGPRGLGRVRRLHGAKLLRHAPGQADRLGRRSRGGDRPDGARARRVQGGGRPHDDPGARPRHGARGLPRGAPVHPLPRAHHARPRAGARPAALGRRHRRRPRGVRSPRPRGADAVAGCDPRRLAIESEVWEVDARLTGQGIYSLLIDGVSYVADVTARDGACVVGVADETYVIQVEEATRYLIRTKAGAAAGAGPQTLTAPLPGKITHVAVRAGDTVAAGDTLLVIEAMKMENELKAGAPGTVAEVRVQPGQAVNAGDVLVVIT